MHALVSMVDDHVYIGMMDDGALEAGCRAWVKWHDDWRVFFTSHFLGSGMRRENKEGLFHEFVGALDERLIPDESVVSMDLSSVRTQYGFVYFTNMMHTGEGLVWRWPYYRLYMEMRNTFHGDWTGVLARLGVPRAGRLFSFMNHDITDRYALTRKAAFSIAADLADATRGGSWVPCRVGPVSYRVPRVGCLEGVLGSCGPGLGG